MALNRNILAIVDTNQNASQIRGIGISHAMPILPVLSRYRLVDFAFSNLVNASIYPVYLLVDKPNRHIFNYIGTGSNWNLHRKNEGINYLFTTKDQIGTGCDLGALFKNLAHINSVQRDYVLYTNARTINRINYLEMYHKLIESGADIVWAYRKSSHAKKYIGINILNTNPRTKRILNFGINNAEAEEKNIDLGIFMMSKKLYVKMVNEAVEQNINTRLQTFLASKVDELKIIGYEVPTWVGIFTSVEDYFLNQMYALLDMNITREVFTQAPLYTREVDQNASYYGKNANVDHCLVGSGCEIDGSVRNSILFRRVHIKKNAKIENCIILTETVINEGAKLKNIIIDQNSIITENKVLMANESAPLVIVKNSKI
ncbi:glucose-1-phosphate adenylyltransferase subunit GlgD [[Mycoplasma] testudinis]|uniref:glucose-1-phosphate adenylyltransferase subunit GlgD n=1 Tax=[Mycoplasma] testudinis TaxID=33924 RepID=UPI0004814A67|nr:glucose-1-phosphate adenylyltransferase subunit GlgD [[Mycoplasma] testudinis]